MDEPHYQSDTRPTSEANTSCTYRFIPSSLSDILSKEKRHYDLVTRQQPEQAKISVANERDRRYIEPPPILQMRWMNCTPDETKKCLQSPFYFMVAHLVQAADPNQILTPTQDYLSGTSVSSLYRLRDVDNSDGGFFVFGDLAVKRQGKYRLRFSLFEIVDGVVQNCKTILSNEFIVHLPKQYPGPLEATFLSRTFSDQGIKMRIRKEHRLHSTASSKRKKALSLDDQLPHKTSTSSPERRRSSQSDEPVDPKWYPIKEQQQQQQQLVESPRNQPLNLPILTTSKTSQSVYTRSGRQPRPQQFHFRYQSVPHPPPPSSSSSSPSPPMLYQAHAPVAEKTSNVPLRDDPLRWRFPHDHPYSLPPPNTMGSLSRSQGSASSSPPRCSSFSPPQTTETFGPCESPLSNPLLAQYHLSNSSPTLPLDQLPDTLPSSPVVLPPLLTNNKKLHLSDHQLDTRLPPIRSIVENNKKRKGAGHPIPTLPPPHRIPS